MKREIRTRIIDPEDAIRASFDLFEAALADQGFPESFDGATFRPMERIELFSDKARVETTVSFEVTLASNKMGRLPEMERVLIEA